jgi:probable HAF family extracellular repeat protein
MKNPSSLLALLAMATLASGLPAQENKRRLPSPAEASYQGLGDFPDGIFESQAQCVTVDGSVVVGSGTTASGKQAFRWTQRNGMVSLGNLPDGSFKQSWVKGVSADGSVIVGYGDPDGSGWNGHQGFRWTQSGGMAGMGSLDGATRYEALGVSADGTVVIGDGGKQAFRWTEKSGIVGLGVLPGRTNSRAIAVSADGAVAVGSSYNLPSWDNEETFVWTQAGGMQGLGYLPGGKGSFPNAVSSDGSVIVGTSDSSSGWSAYRWTRNTGMVGIGGLPGMTTTHPFGVTAHGEIVVGGSFRDPAHGDGFIWDATHGTRSLQNVLETEFGLDLTGWHLLAASGITPDGSVIVGWGTNPSDQLEAFRAVLVVRATSGNTTPAAAATELTFAETGQQVIPITGSAVALGDFNGDGFLDAFVLDQDGYRVYFGDGRGHLTDSGQRLAAPSHVWGAPAVGDVNGDGRLEVITGKAVWLTDDKGHFTAHRERVEISEEGNWTSVALADLNGDGYLDLFAIQDYTSVRVFLNDGKGRFHDSGQKFGGGIPGKDTIAHIALGDVNGDGSIDAVTAGWTEGTSCPNRVWLNDGKGKFRDSGQILYQGTEHVHGAVLGDLNGDGHLDLVLGMNAASRSGLVLLNDGRGNFTANQSLGGNWSQGIALGDFDGDGTLDVFLVCGTARSCPPNQVWLNDGHGRFRDSGVRLGNHPIPQGAALGDFDGDGRLDAFVVSATYSQDGSGAWVPRATPARIWLNTSAKPSASAGSERK